MKTTFDIIEEDYISNHKFYWILKLTTVLLFVLYFLISSEIISLSRVFDLIFIIVFAIFYLFYLLFQDNIFSRIGQVSFNNDSFNSQYYDLSNFRNDYQYQKRNITEENLLNIKINILSKNRSEIEINDSFKEIIEIRDDEVEQLKKQLNNLNIKILPQKPSFLQRLFKKKNI